MEVYSTRGVCSSVIRFEIEDGRLKRVQFEDGCDGSLTAVARLVEGMSVGEAVRRLEGIDCGGKGTSCPDQLAKALKSYMERHYGHSASKAE